MKSVTSQSRASKSQNMRTAPQVSSTVESLNEVLANEFILLMKTLNYHWNIEGPNFTELHEFLDTLYHSLVEHIDEIAERVRAIGGRPLGTLQEMLEVATLKEASSNKLGAHEMLRDLLQDHENLCSGLKMTATRESEDIASVDLLTGLIRKHDKLAWMIRSHIQQ